jgi:ribosomal protein L37AE/L43A
MAHILNQIMSKYHCTTCNKESIMRSGEAELKVLCCKGETPTIHKLGKAPKKVAVSAEAIAGKPVEAPKAPAPQVTKLDVPLSGAGKATK